MFIEAVAYPRIIKGAMNISEKKLICSNAPKLHEIEHSYSSDTLETLISLYLLNFQKLLNINDDKKLDSYQISVLTMDVMRLCRGLTYVELAMMFKRFLSGEFGHFYGQIDIMVMGDWIRQFMKKRGEIICSDNEVRKFILKREQNYEE